MLADLHRGVLRAHSSRTLRMGVTSLAIGAGAAAGFRVSAVVLQRCALPSYVIAGSLYPIDLATSDVRPARCGSNTILKL